MELGIYLYLLFGWLFLALPSIYLLARSRLSQSGPAIGFGFVAAIAIPPIGLLFILALTLMPPRD